MRTEFMHVSVPATEWSWVLHVSAWVWWISYWIKLLSILTYFSAGLTDFMHPWKVYQAVFGWIYMLLLNPGPTICRHRGSLISSPNQTLISDCSISQPDIARGHEGSDSFSQSKLNCWAPWENEIWLANKIVQSFLALNFLGYFKSSMVILFTK